MFTQQDQATGDVILSCKPADWTGFLDALAGADIPDDFMGPGERHREGQGRDPLLGLGD